MGAVPGRSAACRGLVAVARRDAAWRGEKVVVVAACRGRGGATAPRGTRGEEVAATPDKR